MYKNILLVSLAALAGTTLAAPTARQESPVNIANRWRGQMGLPLFAEDAQLVANAQKTVVEGNGQMVHQLNPGTLGQVLAPGQPERFENVYVGGWLCELPDAPGLNGVCSTELGQGWVYNGVTAHAELVGSPDFSRIGCAWSAGIWGCDLA